MAEAKCEKELAVKNEPIVKMKLSVNKDVDGDF